MKKVFLLGVFIGSCCLAGAATAAEQQGSSHAGHGNHAGHGQQQSEHKHHAHKHMDKRFTDPEQLAKSFDNPERDAWQMPARVIADLGIRPGQKVADIGAGTGYFSVRLARSEAKPKVFAVDIEQTMVDYLEKRAAENSVPNLVPVLGLTSKAQLPEAVDVALVVNTYHHIEDRLSYFKDLRGSLRPGGRLAIVDWSKGAPMGPPDEYRFTPKEIQDELIAAGYRFVALHDYLPNQNFLIFERTP